MRKPNDHSIIYTGREVPSLTRNEADSITKPLRAAIRVKQEDHAQRMDPLARLLWTRVYVVKFDVKAHAFGMVHHKSARELRAACGVSAEFDCERSSSSSECDLENSITRDELSSVPMQLPVEAQASTSVIRYYVLKGCVY